ESYVVFGRRDGFPAVLSPDDLDGTNGFRIQGVSEGAVKTRLSRARQQIREWLTDEKPGLPLRKRLQIYTSILL
ncbi:MAG: hypothetical protein AAGJ82_13460, partial [Bacteroidota bacterium]